MHSEVTARLRDLHTTIHAGNDHRRIMLQQIAQSLDQWTNQVGALVLTLPYLI